MEIGGAEFGSMQEQRQVVSTKKETVMA